MHIPNLVPAEAERHRQWFNRLRQYAAVPAVRVQTTVEFYVSVGCYPHSTATIHRERCHRRIGQEGRRLGPFQSQAEALEQAWRIKGVRTVHLCRRCKP